MEKCRCFFLLNRLAGCCVTYNVKRKRKQKRTRRTYISNPYVYDNRSTGLKRRYSFTFLNQYFPWKSNLLLFCISLSLSKRKHWIRCLMCPNVWQIAFCMYHIKCDTSAFSTYIRASIWNLINIIKVDTS